MAVNLSPVFGVAGQLFDNNGNPLAGGKIFTYLAGTTTPAATYTSASGVIAHSNPIVLDGAGRVPSGEIWLTDGIQYKFVVEDSASNLIGTYDNLSGINSNFVAFTNEQEIQTATAGQTVFNLATMQYQPSTNNLSVFVDGVNQYGPGAQYAYVETDSDTVTFVSGLHVGASVKFTTSQLNSSGAGDAENISYTAPFPGSITTNVEAKLAETISVTDFGADPTGVTDSAPAFRLAMQSNANILIPPGTYLLDSTETAPPAAYDDPCVLIQNLDNFIINGYGATINVGNAAGRCGAFQFDRCSNFSLRGVKFVGSTSGDKNSAIATSSCENFVIADILAQDMYYDGGTAIVGSWIVNGIFDNVIGNNVSTYADHAFAYNVTYKNCTGVGLGSTGIGLGTKGLSIVYDGPNVSNNFTSYTYNNSINVNHINCQMTNFVTGAILSSGTGINYIGCNFSDNLGEGSAAGIGLFITYYNGGPFSSVGLPAKDVCVIGCQFKNNGATIPQGGILLDPSDIANSDYIENITITGCTFDDNDSQGIGFISGSNIRYVTAIGNTFTGANQTVPIATNLLPLINYANSDQAGFSTQVFLQQSATFKNNIALNWFDAGGTARPVMFLTAGNATTLRPGSNTSNISFENYAGTATQFRVSNDTTNPVEMVVGGTIKQVSVGAADSGGVGFRALIVPN